MSILLMFYKGGFELQPLLDLWNKTYTKTSKDHFEALFIWIGEDKKGKLKILNAHSELGFNQQLLNWLAKKK